MLLVLKNIIFAIIILTSSILAFWLAFYCFMYLCKTFVNLFQHPFFDSIKELLDNKVFSTSLATFFIIVIFTWFFSAQELWIYLIELL